MQYFAYGSNMLAAQMASRCPEATPGHSAVLKDWRFLINERGVATITPTPGSIVHGRLWKVGPGDVRALDGFEGVAEGRYERRTVVVEPEGHDAESAITYVDHRTTPGPAREGYLDRVVTGAIEAGLPDWYVALLAGG